MIDKENIYSALRIKLEKAGFECEREQKPFFQKRDKELKFVHPELIKKFKAEGLSTRAKKYYIKPLTDLVNSEIGFVTGKSSPLTEFIKPNTKDTHDKSPAWVNRDTDNCLDSLMHKIWQYLNRRN